MSNLPESKMIENQIRLRKRIDVLSRKNLIRKPNINNGNGSRQNHFRQSTACNTGPRKLNLSIQDSVLNGYSNTIKDKLIRPQQLKHSNKVDPAKLSPVQLKIQSQRLYVRKNQEMLGSYFDPICFEEELKYRKKWPDPTNERPTWEALRWQIPNMKSINQISSPTTESSKSVLEYTKSIKELYNMLMNCKCETTEAVIQEESDFAVENFDQISTSNILWIGGGSFESSVGATNSTSFTNFIENSIMNEGTMLNQTLSDHLLSNVHNSDESVMIINLESQSSTVHRNNVALEFDTLSNNLPSDQYEVTESRNSYSSSAEPEGPIVSFNRFAKMENQIEQKAHSSVEASSQLECVGDYSSDLTFLKGDETMKATATLSEGKVVLHCIEADDISERHNAWDKDETITLYSGDLTMETNNTASDPKQSASTETIKSPPISAASSECSSSHSCSSNSPHNSSVSTSSTSSSSTPSSPSVIDDDCMETGFQNAQNSPVKEQNRVACFLHSKSEIDSKLYHTLEKSKESLNELIASTLVLHSLMSGQHQKDIVEEMIDDIP